jgi:hypothetical protein
MWLRGLVREASGTARRLITVELTDVGREDRIVFESAPRVDDQVWVARIPHGGEDAVDDLYAQVASLPVSDYLALEKRLNSLFVGGE